MNKLLKLVAISILSLAFTGINAQNLAQGDGLRTTLKYCTNSIDRSISSGGLEIKLAIQMPEDKAEEYKGNFITKVNIGLVSVKGLDLGKIFILPSLKSNPIYLEDINQELRIGWNEIVLVTPVEITGAELYIGYQFESPKGSSPFGISINDNNPLGDWACINSRWIHLKDSNIDANNSIKVVIEGQNIAETYDLVLSEFKLKDYTKPNIDVDMTGIVSNVGTKTVNNFDIIYKINGVSTTYSVKDLTLTNDDDYKFSIPLRFAEDGKYNVEIVVTNINGDNPDVTPANNEAKTEILVVSEFVRKKMLLEYFTSEQSFNEPSAKQYVQSVLNNNSGVIWIGYHFQDSYENQINNTFADFYNVVAIPSAMLDREPHNGKMLFNPVQLDGYVLLDRLDNPGFMTVKIDGVYTPDDRSLNLSVNGEFLGDNFQGKDLRLTVLLVESEVKSDIQMGADGDYEFSPIVREYLTYVLGDPIKYEANGTYKKSLSYDIPLNYDPDNLKIVAFVNSYDATPEYGSEVANVEQRYLKDMKLNAVEETLEQLNVNIYPNPVRDIININGDFTSVLIYDMTGKLLKSHNADVNKIDVSDLDAGVFILKVTNGNNFITRKITIIK